MIFTTFKQTIQCLKFNFYLCRLALLFTFRQIAEVSIIVIFFSLDISVNILCVLMNNMSIIDDGQ